MFRVIISDARFRCDAMEVVNKLLIDFLRPHMF